MIKKWRSKRSIPTTFACRPTRTWICPSGPPKGKPAYSSKEEYSKILRDHVEKLSEQQNLLYATNRYALLLIFQGMDAAGKDSAIKHVMSGVNPQGCQVFSFKHPSGEELEHDFLWKAERRLPERGQIGIFSIAPTMKKCLIVRVHHEILSNEDLPEKLVEKKHFWRDRYRSIVNMEDHLHRNGTRVIKFFLHLSKQEQKKRFLETDQRSGEELENSALATSRSGKYWKRVHEGP